jgi:K(+)-stimulated pyrophosphate-energized sodium pump
MFPIIARAIGVLASIVGIYFVRAGKRDRTAMAPINRGFFVSAVITAAGVFLVSATYIQRPFNGARAGLPGYKISFAVLGGLVLAVIVSRLTEYFTSTDRSPVHEIADAAETGPATTVLSGTASGLESSVYSVVAIALALGFALWMGGGNLRFSLYLVALTGMGMLATTGVVVSMDTYGPVADNAAGIAEMSGEFDDEAQRVMVSLDAVGNSTKAITKGFAIGSAVIAAVSLFASYVETIVSQRGLATTGDIFRLPATQINIADPKVFIGLLIGGSIAFLFSSLAIRAVGRTAGLVVQEVRRQFREHPGIMDHTEKPEYGKVVDICTLASLRELATPALLAVLSPVIVGFLLGELALGGFLGAAILTGQLMAVYLSNSGGAWDNAKKYIEDGHHGGKGSDAHKAAVIGDTVGDPFKDTAGPALNPLIKVMNLVSLLVLPVVIQQEGHKGMRAVIVAVCTLVVVSAIAYSKRRSEGLAGPAVESIASPSAARVVTPKRRRA